MYESGSSVLITEVGEFLSSTGTFFPDSSLVCVTSEVNSQCCRGRDGGNVGEWHFPDGSMVPRRNQAPMADFTRSGYTQQVRLSRRNDALSQVGEYSCRVPREDGCNGEMHVATISLGKFIQLVHIMHIDIGRIAKPEILPLVVCSYMQCSQFLRA